MLPEAPGSLPSPKKYPDSLRWGILVAVVLVVVTVVAKSPISPFSLTADIGGFSSGTSTELAFLSGPYLMTAGFCSPILTVQAQNASGTPVNADSPVFIQLMPSPTGTTNAYLDPACTQVASSVTIGTGQSSASFYVMSQANSTTTAMSITASSSEVAGTSTEQWGQNEFFNVFPTSTFPSQPTSTP